MKIGIFTDSHYSSQTLTCGVRYNSRSLEKIRQAYTFFAEQNCELVVCLGDLIDREQEHKKEVDNLKAVAQVIHNSPIPTICLMGNHDAFAFTQEEFYNLLPSCQPYDKDLDGKSLVFLDACYFQNGDHYRPGDSDWTNTFFPHTEQLKKRLEKACESVYIFIHQNLDTTISSDHCLHNAEEINALLKACGKVKAVFQGHYHAGNHSDKEGIPYVTFPAMCQNENAWFLEEI